ncbi:NAD(P)H-quinone oxidoreductase [Phenylobacterium sp. VNQ135]|uniref:NAD(P)H-quinone oxidoreductase n=1 Tax=Phenylobacterium sp. VNQ135 TaxID=3400922 RepID=UPI003C00CA9D
MQCIEVVDGGAALQLTERPKPPVGPGEVLIKVAFSGVNRADLSQRAGRYPPPLGASDILGIEVAGEIVAVGKAAGPWSPGDKVCALVAGGGYADHCLAPVEQLAPVPPGATLAGAAALLEAACTAWDNVWRRGRLQPAETLLVHGGGSGVGVAAIQIARALGHRVVATAGTPEKVERCRRLGASLAIDYRAQDFVAETLAFTEGQGVDVILDLVGGPYLGRNLQCLAPEGRLSVISVSGGPIGELDLALMMRRRLSVIASTLRARSPEAKRQVITETVEVVWRLVARGEVVPVIDEVFPAADAEAAHARMRASAHFGKLLLAW